MKTISLFLLAFTFTQYCFAQSIERSVISSFGSSYSGNNLLIDQTLGEVITFTGETNTNFVTQGFHQPPAIVSICQAPIEETINASACIAYELNGEIYTSPGTYAQLLTAENGCDSVLYLNLQLNSLSNVVFLEGEGLTAIQNDAIYSWTFCGEEAELSTLQTFYPEESGNYHVTITQDDCEVISECISFTVGIKEDTSFIELIVFPNPVTSTLQLKASGINVPFALDLYDAVGALVMTKKITGSTTSLQVDLLPAGTYFIVVKSDQFVTRKAFIKA